MYIRSNVNNNSLILIFILFFEADALEHPYLKQFGKATDLTVSRLERGKSPKHTTVYPAKCYQPVCPGGIDGIKQRLKVPRFVDNISDKFQRFKNFITK